MTLYSLIALFALQFVIVLVLMIGFRRTKRKVPRSSGEISGMSIIIPFRNEEQRITPLIDSINEAHLPENVEFIFVDDHSTDKTVSTFTSQMQTPFQLIKNDGRGKKAAIRTAVRQATYSKILTLDADVSFSKLCIIEAQFFNMQDMTIFPVRMMGNSPIQMLGSFEFSFLQLVTFGMAGFRRAVLSNGANLGFDKRTFLQIDRDRTDYHIPSGDDIFLLNQMRKKNRAIWGVSNVDLIVSTKGPKSLIKLLKQRKRWFGKMTEMISFYAVFGLFLLILSQIGLILAIFGLKWSIWFLLPLGLKFVSEWLIDLTTFRRFSILRFLALIVHQIWYPIYLLLLIFPLGKEEKWEV